MNRQFDSIHELIQKAPPFLFFTGKGGVGKTTLSCATAVALADQGKRVLLVSTDPASNLAHVFETDIGEQTPTPIKDVPNLHALNIDPEAAAQAYRDRIVGPARGMMPADVVRRMFRMALEGVDGSGPMGVMAISVGPFDTERRARAAPQCAGLGGSSKNTASTVADSRATESCFPPLNSTR